MDLIATGFDAVSIGERSVNLVFTLVLIFVNFSVYALTHLYMFFIMTEILILAFCAMFAPTNPFKIFSNFILYNYYVLKFVFDVITLFVNVIANLFKASLGAVISIFA